MGTEGQGSARIVLVGRTPSEGRSEPSPRRPARREPRRRATPGAIASHWTVRRLINGASLGGVATVAGGLVFQKNFQLFGDNNRFLLAMGFGLFVIGMVVFTLCLIGLASRGVRSLAATRGWGVAVLAAIAPALAFSMLAVAGVLAWAFPALFALIAAGGFALALKR
ncbi:MAG TPA: hypothetical protein VMY78_03305 [Solirubrobacteraceae bacterium]|nr:hypothetical protein [Solirubrobacteraceae bacterium]